MLEAGRKRVAGVYVALQAIIWVKAALFFAWFGHGKSMPFSLGEFSAEALRFGFFFHEGMHIAIGVLALLFGGLAAKWGWREMLAGVAAAVFLHNIGYWLTASHPNAVYSTLDFARDFALLFLFVAAGYWGKGLLCRGREREKG